LCKNRIWIDNHDNSIGNLNQVSAATTHEVIQYRCRVLLNWLILKVPYWRQSCCTNTELTVLNNYQSSKANKSSQYVQWLPVQTSSFSNWTTPSIAILVLAQKTEHVQDSRRNTRRSKYLEFQTLPSLPSNYYYYVSKLVCILNTEYIHWIINKFSIQGHLTLHFCKSKKRKRSCSPITWAALHKHPVTKSDLLSTNTLSAVILKLFGQIVQVLHSVHYVWGLGLEVCEKWIDFLFEVWSMNFICSVQN